MKNICIGLFEGETLPERLAAFKDVKDYNNSYIKSIGL